MHRQFSGESRRAEVVVDRHPATDVRQREQPWGARWAVLSVNRRSDRRTFRANSGYLLAAGECALRLLLLGVFTVKLLIGCVIDGEAFLGRTKCGYRAVIVTKQACAVTLRWGFADWLYPINVSCCPYIWFYFKNWNFKLKYIFTLFSEYYFKCLTPWWVCRCCCDSRFFAHQRYR